VAELAAVLPRTGAVQVYPKGTLITDEALDRLLPGDILLLHHATSRYKHTGVYLGNRLMNDNSSGKEHVVTRHPSVPGYRYMAVWRYPH
jgi:cell wall-associated NlpC family hydrolase